MSVPVVEIENLVKRYQELVALDHFNLTIEEGEIFGLLGPNGSGKTTTINCILALLAFDKGTVRALAGECAGQLRSETSDRRCHAKCRCLSGIDRL